MVKPTPWRARRPRLPIRSALVSLAVACAACSPPGEPAGRTTTADGVSPPATSVGRLGPCPASLAPLVREPPRLPPFKQRPFDVEAQVDIVIDRDGRVIQADLVTFRTTPVVGSNESGGHREPVLEAVRRWRYPPQPTLCVARVPVLVRHDKD